MGDTISHHPTHQPPYPQAFHEAKMSPGNGPTVEVSKEDVLDTYEENDHMYPDGGSIVDSIMTPSVCGSHYIDGRR